MDVLQRVAIHNQHIGNLTDLKGAQLIFKITNMCTVLCGSNNDLTPINVERQFSNEAFCKARSISKAPNGLCS
jgi:hypothetical protein